MKVCVVGLLLVAILGLAAANQYSYHYGDVSKGYILNTIRGRIPEGQGVTTVDVTPPDGYLITGIKTVVNTLYNVSGPSVDYEIAVSGQDVKITFPSNYLTLSNYFITVLGMPVHYRV